VARLLDLEFGLGKELSLWKDDYTHPLEAQEWVAYRREIHDAIAALNHARFILAKATDRWKRESVQETE
jgi:hypothetical protein